jgi:16S rRNA (guanine527-N7)-methyltransferase
LTAGLEALARGDGDIRRVLDGRLDAAASALHIYIEEIERFNPAYGLVGAKDRGELVVKHILDSLAPLGILVRLLASKEAAFGAAAGGTASTQDPAVPPRIADVGSGAGLPGIPLAIARPGVRFTLIERMGRRVGFLRNTLAVLGLGNVELEAVELEKAAPGRFDLVVCRAFRPLERPILGGLLALLREGGSLAAYKGRRDAVRAEMEAVQAELRAAGGDLKAAAGGAVLSWESLPCPVPFLDEERHLLVIPKGGMAAS